MALWKCACCMDFSQARIASAMLDENQNREDLSSNILRVLQL